MQPENSSARHTAAVGTASCDRVMGPSFGALMGGSVLCSHPPVSAGLRGGIALVSRWLTGPVGRPDSRGVGVSVLGPLEVDGLTRELGRRDRVVLSALVVADGDPVSTETLADALWGEAPPASWPKVVQGCVVRLRKLLGSAAIESGDFGYRLALTELELDSARFERGLERARAALAGDDPDRAAYLASEALTLWRGQALADLEEWEPGRVRAGQLDGLQDGHRGTVRGGADRSWSGCVGAGGGTWPGRPGPVPGAALGAAGNLTAPVRAAG